MKFFPHHHKWLKCKEYWNVTATSDTQIWIIFCFYKKKTCQLVVWCETLTQTKNNICVLLCYSFEWSSNIRIVKYKYLDYRKFDSNIMCNIANKTDTNIYQNNNKHSHVKSNTLGSSFHKSDGSSYWDQTLWSRSKLGSDQGLWIKS